MPDAIASRISLPLTADGSAVDWPRVRQSTARKFEGLLQTDPNIRQAYKEANGLNEAADTDNPFDVTDANVHGIIDGIAAINANLFQLIAAKWMPHPLAGHIPGFRDAKGKPAKFLIEPDILVGMRFTEEQHKELDARGARIARKYQDNMPLWLRKHLDLYLFAAMFISYTAENAKTVITNQVTRDVARVQERFATARAQAKTPDSDVPKTVPTNGADSEPPLQWKIPTEPEPPQPAA